MAFFTQTLAYLLLCTSALATRHLSMEYGLDSDAPSQFVARRYLLDTQPGAVGGNTSAVAGLANTSTTQLYAGTTPPVDINVSATAPSQPLFRLPALTNPTPSGTQNNPAAGSGSVTITLPGSNVPAPKSSMPSPTPKPTPTDKGSAPAAAKGINSSKAYPNGTTCSIYTTSIPTCSTDQPIPACCTSSKSSAQCVSYDSGDSVNCPNSVPFPACCEARPQPLSVCVRPSSTGFCFAEMPVPACCDPKAAQCSVFADGGDVNCDTGFFAGCCPA